MLKTVPRHRALGLHAAIRKMHMSTTRQTCVPRRLSVLPTSIAITTNSMQP